MKSDTPLGEVDNTIYKKFKEKYETQKDELQSKIENPSLSSSNLELAIDKALTLSESLEKIWVDGGFKTKTKTAKFSLSIWIGLRQAKRQSSNQSERYFWVNSDFIEGNLQHKKGEPIPVNQFSGLVTQGGLNPQPSEPKSDILSS